MDTKPVIIVGAGLSGLSAAQLLREHGMNVIVLEAKERVGGRTYTLQNEDNDLYVDLGGSYVCPEQVKILELARKVGIEAHPIHNTGKSLVISGDNRFSYEIGKPAISFLRNPISFMDINHYCRTFDQICEEIPYDKPWESKHAARLDSMTMKEFIKDNCWTTVAMDMASTLVTINVTCETHEVSALWFLWFIKQRGRVNRIFSNSNQGWKFLGGAQPISNNLAKRLGCVRLNCDVRGVEQHADYVVVNAEGYVHEGSHVILTVPPSQQSRITFQPDISAHRGQLQQRMPLGSVTKVILYYEKTFWRERGFSGSVFTTTDHPVLYILDDTKPDDSSPALLGFLAGKSARELALKTKEERKRIVCEFYQQVFQSEEALKPIRYEEYNWMNEKYIGGAYTSVCGPGVLTGYGRFLKEPYGRIHYAGTETATLWSGYMDGAVQSGQRAAREVIRDLGMDIQEEPEQFFEPFEWSWLERHAPSIKTVIQMSSLVIAISGMAYLVGETGRNEVAENFRKAISILSKKFSSLVGR